MEAKSRETNKVFGQTKEEYFTSIARAGITPSISTVTVRKVMRKAGFKWSHA